MPEMRYNKRPDTVRAIPVQDVLDMVDDLDWSGAPTWVRRAHEAAPPELKTEGDRLILCHPYAGGEIVCQPTDMLVFTNPNITRYPAQAFAELYEPVPEPGQD